MLYDLARSALFRLDAERSHRLTLAAFRRWPKLSTLPFHGAVPEVPVDLLGLRFRNPVGLAAGLDKNAECIAAWDALGFGFVEVGTVTPRAQPGNPQPRLFRLTRQEALINRLGFNNEGVDALVRRVKETPRNCVLGINIGKNADTPLESAALDYELCLRKVHAVADYVTVNISSPNTKNLRDLQHAGQLRSLLDRISYVRAELADREGRRVPMLVKIAPDLDADGIAAVAAEARQAGVDGLIATNTTLQRPGLDDEPMAQAAGGLSGRPLHALSRKVVAAVRKQVGKDYPLIGVGGIFSGADAAAMRKAGADLVQIYSGFIYRGPALIAECARAWT